MIAVILGGCSFSAAAHDPDPSEGPDVDAGAAAPGDPPGTTTPTPRRCNSVPATETNLVLCLDFDGSPVLDGSTYQHDPAVTAVAAGTRGTEPAAVLSPSSLILVDESTGLDLTHAMTIEMWMHPKVPTHDFYLVDNNGQYSLSYEDNGKVRCSISGGPTAETIALPPNVWYHVGCTYDGATLKVFVAGELAVCRSNSQQGLVFSTGTLGTSIGVNTDAGASNTPAYRDHFEGLLDNVHMFSRVLAPSEMCAAAGRSSCLLASCS